MITVAYTMPACLCYSSFIYLKVKEKLVDIKGVNGRRTQYNGNKGKVQNDK
jgi:hypothetical protein